MKQLNICELVDSVASSEAERASLIRFIFAAGNFSFGNWIRKRACEKVGYTPQNRSIASYFAASAVWSFLLPLLSSPREPEASGLRRFNAKQSAI